ncbi:MAG: CPBP family intramembrane metalloprotease [Kutzneria sp.]|nr:CPBP family intramembrane metalloprotease [Kutzneria sp.]MBV9844990.1 CPBP family intramembrane metalloprotease [Kutzneria sp.]
MSSAVVELVALSLPSAVLVLARMRQRGADGRQVWAAVGLRAGRPRDYAAAAVICVALTPVMFLVLRTLPPSVADDANIMVGRAGDASGYVAIVVLTLAEEMFFRGFLAGVLVRRFGFAVGNAAQALVFLAPHCLLLLANLAIWPVLPLQLAGGWLAGWLRHRSGSVGPGWLMHSAANLLTPLLLTL